jgi:hypothetical protein
MRKQLRQNKGCIWAEGGVRMDGGGIGPSLMESRTGMRTALLSISPRRLTFHHV